MSNSDDAEEPHSARNHTFMDGSNAVWVELYMCVGVGCEILLAQNMKKLMSHWEAQFYSGVHEPTHTFLGMKMTALDLAQKRSLIRSWEYGRQMSTMVWWRMTSFWKINECFKNDIKLEDGEHVMLMKTSNRVTIQPAFHAHTYTCVILYSSVHPSPFIHPSIT